MPGRNTGQEKVFAFSIVYLTGCTPYIKGLKCILPTLFVPPFILFQRR